MYNNKIAIGWAYLFLNIPNMFRGLAAFVRHHSTDDKLFRLKIPADCRRLESHSPTRRNKTVLSRRAVQCECDSRPIDTRRVWTLSGRHGKRVGRDTRKIRSLCTAEVKKTRSSAIAEGSRDASCQLKSCQLPRNSAETTCTTSPFKA